MSGTLIMNGNQNIGSGVSKNKYLSDLFLRQNNTCKVLHDRDSIRTNDILLNNLKNIEEEGHTSLNDL